MQRHIVGTLGRAVTLAGIVGVLAASADAAPTVLKSRLLCDTDGTIATPFTDVVGSVQVKEDGEVRVKVKGLRPDTPYTCRMICGAEVADAACSTDGKGAMNAKLPGLGRQGALAPGCPTPAFTMFTDDPDDDGDFCQTGYGLDTP